MKKTLDREEHYLHVLQYRSSTIGVSAKKRRCLLLSLSRSLSFAQMVHCFDGCKGNDSAGAIDWLAS